MVFYGTAGHPVRWLVVLGSDCQSKVDVGQNFVWHFQARHPQPSVYIRCLVQSLILHNMNVLDQRSIKRLLFDSLEEIVLPGSVVVDTANDDVEAPHDPRFQIVKKMELFEQRVADVRLSDYQERMELTFLEAYIDIFRGLCMNRSRMRRILCHLVIDWDNIQLDASRPPLII